ncbi:MAG: hypothetical protein HMLKMBBP_01450 [Planctomycetes bacterium]|nr:hypothetical protein [Planctomycetota bacterium]
MSTPRAFHDLADRLDAAGIPWVVTGSVAAAVHGLSRTTVDFDLVIDPSERALTSFLNSLPAESYYVDRGAAIDALRRRSLFNVIDQSDLWKFDLIVSHGDPFARALFARRCRASVGGREAWVASSEDVVVSKLVWAAGTASTRQVADVREVLRIQGARLDRAYVTAWADRLGVGGLWRTVTAGEPPG